MSLPYSLDWLNTLNPSAYYTLEKRLENYDDSEIHSTVLYNSQGVRVSNILASKETLFSALNIWKNSLNKQEYIQFLLSINQAISMGMELNVIPSACQTYNINNFLGTIQQSYDTPTKENVIDWVQRIQQGNEIDKKNREVFQSVVSDYANQFLYGNLFNQESSSVVTIPKPITDIIFYDNEYATVNLALFPDLRVPNKET